MSRSYLFFVFSWFFVFLCFGRFFSLKKSFLIYTFQNLSPSLITHEIVSLNGTPVVNNTSFFLTGSLPLSCTLQPDVSVHKDFHEVLMFSVI